jgi:hypothetical protein
MKKFLSFLRRSFLSLDRSQRYVLYTWLLVLLFLPLLSAVFSEQILLQGFTLAILLQVVFVVLVLYRSWGWREMFRTSSEVLFLVWAVIAIIIRSGLPYGDLQFTALQKPLLLGVPIIVPVSWLMMLPPAWAISRLITRRFSGCLLRLMFILVSAFAFTAWEIYFQPFLASLGVLQWIPSGGFSGIPGQHFFGILFLSALITFAVSPKHLQGGPLILIYLLVCLADILSLSIIHALLWPIVLSTVLMGVVITSALLLSK